MPCYYRCIDDGWKPVHDDPMVVEAAERIIAAGEPTPKPGEVYTMTGLYVKGLTGPGYARVEAIGLAEFDWSEYEVMCSDGVARHVDVYWNKEKFEYVGEEFIPDDVEILMGSIHQVETFSMVVELEYDISISDEDEDEQ